MRKSKPTTQEPKKCWTGDQKKIIYPDFDTANQSARLIEHQHNLPKNHLHPYKCEYANHWHLASTQKP